MAKRFFSRDASKGMDLENGKRHYDSNGKPLGGIKAKVVNTYNQVIEVEKGEVIITRDAVSNPKKYKIEGTTKEILSTLNQEGGGVPINETEAEILAKYKEGGKIGDKYHLGGDMTKHLAPNGKPSNLNHEQWHLVRTPEFKAWFGDWENDPETASKVIDKETKEPLVVYHGSNKKFDSFRADENQYVYFTDDINLADTYATHRSKKSNGEKFIYDIYLKIINPLIIDANFESWDNISTESIENSDIAIKDLLKRGVDTITTNFAPKIAIKNGFDGVIISNIYDGVGYGKDAELSNVYVALKPNQIKLADGSNTTFDSDNDDIRFAEGGEIPSLIEKGVVDLKFHETTPEHAEIYGLTAEKPLYIQTLYVNDNKRLQGIGTKVLHYIYSIAKQNGNDVIFGHINQKASFSKDEKETTFNDIDMVKNWLHKNGYAINEDNNDFHKVVKFKTGGSIGDMTPSEIKAFYDTPEGKKLDAETYAEWKSLVNMSKSEITNFYNSPEGKQAGLSESEAKEQGIDSGRESARWIMKMKDIPYKLWSSDMWRWAKKQINFIKRMSGMKGSLYNDKGEKTRKHTALLIWGHKPTKKFEGGGYVPKDVFAKSENERNEDYEGNWNLWTETLLKNESLPIYWTTSESRKELYGDSFYITIFNQDWAEFAKLRFSGHSVFNTSRLQNEFHNPNISRFYEIVSRAMNLKQQEKYPENSIKFEGGGELSKGTAHEMEHLETLKKVAEGKITPEEAVVETAKTHIAENPEYYEDLEKMESENDLAIKNKPKVDALYIINKKLKEEGSDPNDLDDISDAILVNRPNDMPIGYEAELIYKYREIGFNIEIWRIKTPKNNFFNYKIYAFQFDFKIGTVFKNEKTKPENENKSILETQVRGLELLVPMLEGEQKNIIEKQIRGLKLLINIV